MKKQPQNRTEWKCERKKKECVEERKPSAYIPRSCLSRNATKLETIRARWAEFRTPRCLMSASQKYMSSSTPMNFEKLSAIQNVECHLVSHRPRNFCLFFFFCDLPWYWRRSNRSNQAPISKCGCCGVTIICDILFLFNVAKRKLHAIPGGGGGAFACT